MTRILIPGIMVDGANLENSPYCVSFPLTAVAGLIDSLTLGDKGFPFFDAKFAVLLHQYQQYEGQSKNPMALCKGSGGAPQEKDRLNPPLVQEVKGRLLFSLILDFADEDYPDWTDAYSDEEVDAEEENDSQRLASTLMSCSFAGGNIVSLGFKQQRSTAEDLTMPRIFNEANCQGLLQSLENSWLIKDRSDLLEDRPDKLASLMDALALFPQRNAKGEIDKSKGYRKHQRGWLYATMTGYQLLEEPIERSPLRDPDCKHAFCEPVLGLAELVHGPSLIYQQSKQELFDFLGRHDCFWRWNHHVESRSWTLSARSHSQTQS